MAFAAGAVVFPGGRIDPDDYVVAARHGFAQGDVDGAARRAAPPETPEGTGVGVGWPALAEGDRDGVRRALLGGRVLSEILGGCGLRAVGKAVGKGKGGSA